MTDSASTTGGVNSDQRSIWFITAGEYSEYQVLCAYEQEDDARAAVEAGVGDDYQALALIPSGVIPRKVPLYHATVRGDGGEIFSYEYDEWDFNVGADVEGFEARGTIYLSGPDRERVAKAAHDRAARLRAERDGIA